MSGLGIDFGPNSRSPSRPSRPRDGSRSRSHTVSSEGRRVRIASGQPRILGDEYTPDLASTKRSMGASQTQRSISMAAGPSPPLSVSTDGMSSDEFGIYDSYTEEGKDGYVPDGFGGWIREEDIGQGRVPPPMTPSDSPLIIPPPPQSKLHVTNPSPSKSMLTPPTSEASTSPAMVVNALPQDKNAPHSPASLAFSDLTVSSKYSGASTSSSSQKTKSVRKLISSRRPSSAAGSIATADDASSVSSSQRNRSRSRSMSLFLGRPKSATAEKGKANEAAAGSISGRSSPTKSNKLSKSRSHASLVSWSATGWAGTGQSHGPGLGLGLDFEDDIRRHEELRRLENDDFAGGSPESVSAYSDGHEEMAADVTVVLNQRRSGKEAFRGSPQQLYDSPVRVAVDETPKADQRQERSLRSSSRSSTRMNAHAAEFNPRPPSAAAMRTISTSKPKRQPSIHSIASSLPTSESGTAGLAAGGAGLPPMRSARLWAGLEGASRGEAMVCLDPFTGQYVQGEAIIPGRIISGRVAGLGVGEGSILADPSSGADPYGSTNSKRSDRAKPVRNPTVDVAPNQFEDPASMLRRQSHMSWGGESTSELGPHDSASNVGGRVMPMQHQQAATAHHGKGKPQNKTILRQQSVPVLPSATNRAAGPQGHDGRTLQHQQSYNALGLEMGGNGAGGMVMDRRTNQTVTGASLTAEERRRRQSTMMTTSTNSSNGTTSSSSLDRSGTLLSASANPARRSRELNRLLGNSARKLSASAAKSTGADAGFDGVRGHDGRSGDGESSVGPSASASASGLGIEGLPASLSSTIVPNVKKGTSTGAPSSVGSGTTTGTNAAVNSANAIAVLEQAKSGKARVEVDLVLETDLVVEGGTLRGRLQVKVRKPSEGEGIVMLAQPKIRIVGFEELMGDDTRHIFYHHAMAIDGDLSNGGPSEPYVLHGSPNIFSPEASGGIPLPCFASSQDHEGYSRGKEGTHSIPFALDVPIGRGAKGSYRGKTAVVRYIVIGSVKLKSSNGTDRSIAHFYRHMELFPYLNPAVVLSPAPKPLVSQAEKGLFMGGSGKVLLTASLHRPTWVAGQRVYVNIAVSNETSKKVKNLHLALVRTVTLFRPKPEFNVGFSVPVDPTESYIDPDACTTSTTRKKICEETVELGQKGTKGSVTARGWWTGVDPGCSLDVSHYMTIPADALTISRGRHVEVVYSIKVAVSGTFYSDVSVELPLRVINFLSLDPPPARVGTMSSFGASNTSMSRSWSQAAQSDNALGISPRSHPHSLAAEAPLIARVRSMDALKSPTKLEVAPRHQLHLPIPNTRAPAGASSSQGGDDDRQTSRRLQHQKSLDFINHAIRSATARRGLPTSNASSPLGLGIEVPDDNELQSMEYRETHSIMSTDHLRRLSMASLSSHTSQLTVSAMDPHCLPYVHPQVAFPHLVPPVVNPQLLLNSVTLDQAGYDYSYDEMDQMGNLRNASASSSPLSMNDESVDEVQMVMHSTQMEGLPVFGVPAPYLDEEDEDGNTTFDSVSTARCIREEPEAEACEESKTEVHEEPEVEEANVTAPLQFSKKNDLEARKTSPAKLKQVWSSSTPPSATASAPTPVPSKQKIPPRPSIDDLKARKDSPVKPKQVSSFSTPPSATVSTPAPVPSKQKIPPRPSTEDLKARKNSPVKAKVSSSSTPPSAAVSTRNPVPSKQKMAPRPSTATAAVTSRQLSLRHTASLANIGSGGSSVGCDADDDASTQSARASDDKGLQRSISTHNLRGSSVVIPSVRSKIAMLESRSQLLRDFAAPTVTTPTMTPSATATPIVAGDTSLSIGEVPVRRAKNSAAPPASSSNSNASTPTSTRVRKPSVLSIAASEDSMSTSSSRPDYLKRSDSLMSFKAPVLRSVKALVQERERGK
ncbi:unnamed protein product [Tilletia laevis]|uniref:Arrestin C-terminal-like domain-containing protein n=3 Tax=Tilletia TaxID=13289 RepID=A0A9N8LHI2_9BASI|nr:hypothetical protein CF336_g3746 [Tilletia laevis]KAE8261635.1 hypothetical protein A4X03_0g3087 [Tilletia caries]KAE8203821.1 hypothetical protein CF335_g2879 [Tilletia laevis]CAD6897733.1 unnamed protein product [Tilletia laevis]CAD6965847.1 unnamed protein product [Tilletia laevis]